MFCLYERVKSMTVESRKLETQQQRQIKLKLAQVRQEVYTSISSLVEDFGKQSGCAVWVLHAPDRRVPRGKYIVLTNNKSIGMRLADEMKGIIDKGNRRLESLFRAINEPYSEIDYDVKSCVCAGEVLVTVSEASTRRRVLGSSLILRIKALEDDPKKKPTVSPEVTLPDGSSISDLINPDQYYTVRRDTGQGYRIHWYDPADGRKHTAHAGDITICVGASEVVPAHPRKRRSDAIDWIISTSFGKIYPSAPLTGADKE